MHVALGRSIHRALLRQKELQSQQHPNPTAWAPLGAGPKAPHPQGGLLGTSSRPTGAMSAQGLCVPSRASATAGPGRLMGGSGSPQQLQMINPRRIFSPLSSALESIVSPAFKDTLVGSLAMLFCFGGIPLKQ